MIVVGRGSQMRTLAGARTIMAAGRILRIGAGAGRRAQFGRLRGSPGDAEPAQIASCIGWAPLPPEAGCEIDVGVGNWVDYTCGLGPDAYTFVNVVDFGTDNFSHCGTCLIDRGRYVNIFEQTTNITNISYVNIVNQTNQKYVNIYNGGPDPNWCNTEIQKLAAKKFRRSMSIVMMILQR